MEKKAARWWDKLGKPQYGGTMSIRFPADIMNFDPYYESNLAQIFWAWMESLATEDWTSDPTATDDKILFRPNQYRKGYLAESWEFIDPSTFIVHLRKGIHWQNIPPVNGREFTADDVVYHYHRLFGLGKGLTPSPDHATVPAYKNLISVSSTDKYTVAFKWKIANPDFIMVSLLAANPSQVFEAREAVEKWGDLSDWHHAIGTGPFILKDFIPGSSAALIKNLNYWGNDERYPHNKLPYVDELKFLIMPDDVEAFEAMRTGKIDLISPVSLQDAQLMQKTNPEILRICLPFSTTITVDPRIDVAPFNDIRIRKAMQMAIDLPTIAKSYYHSTVEPYPAALSSRDIKGLGFPYEEWPQELKDEYAYNPSAAKQLLADAGYPNGFQTNIVADAAGDTDLLQIIKSYFAQVGIDMEIRTMDSASWKAFVIRDHKHDQLAQGSIPSSGYTYEPIRFLHRLQTGHPGDRMISDPVCDTLYTKVLAETNLDEVLRIYRDANEYVARQHFSISLLQPQFFALCQPWLKGYNAQFGTITGAVRMSFYLARFWIDQNLKKSMEH